MRRSRNPRNLSGVGQIDLGDDSMMFLNQRMVTCFIRLLKTDCDLNREFFEFLYHVLNPELASEFMESMMKLVPSDRQLDFRQDEDPIADSYSFSHTACEASKLIGWKQRHQIREIASQMLAKRLEEFTSIPKTVIEDNIGELKTMFCLDHVEAEICVFMFTVYICNEFSSFFADHLCCNQYRGRKLLATILECKNSQLAAALSGKLTQIGILEPGAYRGCLEITHSFAQKLQSLNPEEFRNQFIKPLNCELIQLDSHMVEREITENILKILSYKPGTATHILLYGPPGTGKTSYAFGIASRLGLRSYRVEHSSKENADLRRAAITACVNMASETNDALFVADDSDLILNTGSSWVRFGETPDKSWLHETLEKPGVRMIWIVNSTDNIEESVARRFAFSVKIKPFTREQRAQIWNSMIRKHRVKRFLKDDDIQRLADRFAVSAGVIDNAIRKAAESCEDSASSFRKSVKLALESSESLIHSSPTSETRSLDRRNFNLEGLNLSGANVKSLLNEVTAFDKYTRKNRSGEPATMSMLFHGPPGSGKSALARYVATHLGKEIVFKRASDLFSMWVGGTEKNIREAYLEATSRNAVLIFDEADSLIFGRDRAEHSWEISFTNEFLTWMESFNGIQIFTTNRLKDLDSASLRRFNHKIEFGYLKPEGNVIFYKSYLAPLTRRTLDISMKDSVRKIEGLTPGDFKSVKDKFRFRDRKRLSHESLISALADESRIKSMHAGQARIGF